MTDAELAGLLLNFTGVTCFDVILIGRKGWLQLTGRLFWPLATAGVGAAPLALLLFVRTQGMPSGFIYGVGSGLIIGMFVPFLLRGGTDRIRVVLSVAALAFAIAIFFVTRWDVHHIWIWRWRFFFVAVVSYSCIVWFAQTPFYEIAPMTFAENIDPAVAFRARLMALMFGTIVAATIYATLLTTFAGFIVR